jgi:hypothetical protein
MSAMVQLPGQKVPGNDATAKYWSWHLHRLIGRRWRPPARARLVPGPELQELGPVCSQ